MQEGDEVARRSNEEAVAAFKAANYDLAISKYNEGIAAVPDFWAAHRSFWAVK